MVLKSIALNMIVKNETKIILRCLESVVQWISYYVICDTGSTDGTQKMIKEFMDKHGVPGEIPEIPWKNFGYNRTEALKLAKNKADYILLIDADMTLEVIDPKGPDWREDLDADFYQVDQHNGSHQYSNVRLLKGDVDFNYMGVTHEYVNCLKPNHVCKKLESIMMPDKMDGANRPDKYVRDRDLLLTGLQDKTLSQALRQRYTFYLAQSYRDMNNLKKASKYYKQRVEMGGWDEEVYYSLFQVGTISLVENDPLNAIDYLLKAYQFRPTRAEPLYQIIKWYRIKGQYELAKLYLPKALKTTFPKNDLLFIDTTVYDFLIQLEIILISRHTNDAEFGRTFAEGLMHNPKMPGEVCQMALNEMPYYVKNLKEYCPSFKKHQYTINKIDDKFNLMNPSILYKDEKYLINTREVNYKFDIVQNKYHYEGTIDTYNKLAVVDNLDFTYLETTQVICKDEDLITFPCHITGIEDIRLIEFQDKLYGIATCIKTNPLGINEMVLLHFEGTDISKVVRLYCPHISREGCQKNWCPMIQEGKLKLLFSSQPTLILIPDLETGECSVDKQINNSLNMSSYRGSSQLVKVEDQYIYLIHQVAFVNNRRYYLHRFVRMDENLNIKRISPLFTLNDQCTIEFASGMCNNGKELVITWGVEDYQAWIGTVNIDEVTSFNL